MARWGVATRRAHRLKLRYPARRDFGSCGAGLPHFSCSQRCGLLGLSVRTTEKNIVAPPLQTAALRLLTLRVPSRHAPFPCIYIFSKIQAGLRPASSLRELSATRLIEVARCARFNHPLKVLCCCSDTRFARRQNSIVKRGGGGLTSAFQGYAPRISTAMAPLAPGLWNLRGGLFLGLCAVVASDSPW